MASLVAQRLKHLPAMWRPGFNPWVGKIPWRRKWQPTPVFLPGESHGRRNLVGYSPRGHKESDTTERLQLHHADNIMWYWLNSIHHRTGDVLAINRETINRVFSLSRGKMMIIVQWKWKSLSRVQLFVTPWTVAYQVALSMGFSRQEYWSGLPFPSPGDLPNPGIEPGSPAL